MQLFAPAARIRPGVAVAIAASVTLVFSVKPSVASIVGDQIYGVLAHNGLTGFNNWNVGASSPPTPAIVVDPGIEFEIPPGNGNYGFTLANADFAPSTITLQLGNPQSSGDAFVAVFDMYFTDLNYGGSITNVQLVSSNFPGGISSSFGPDSFEAHLPSGGFIPANTTYTAVFQVTAIPEPATLALLGVGAVALRRRRQREAH